MGKALLLLIIVFVCACKPNQKPSPVLASTSWTAAYALAAGASNVGLIAPASMLHPAEYELKLSDIKRIRSADFILFAGYEIMVQQMLQGVDDQKDKLIKIETGFDIDKMEETIIMVAEKFGTLDSARKNIKQIKQNFEATKQMVEERGLDKIPVLVHFHQQKYIKELGMNIVGVFGPQPPEAYEIKNLLSTGAQLIIDNIHNPSGESLQESGRIDRVLLINFPGPENTRTLSDVIDRNGSILKDR